jgi:hypothetical protein
MPIQIIDKITQIKKTMQAVKVDDTTLQVTTQPDPVVSNYTRAPLEQQVINLQAQIDNIQSQIDDINAILSIMDDNGIVDQPQVAIPVIPPI